MRLPFSPPPGLDLDDTRFADAGRWRDADKVRFRLGRPQLIGGWINVLQTALTGVCRSVFPWTDNADTLNLAFGTHSNLQVFQGGALYDVTPTLAIPPVILDSNPLSVTSGSGVVTVSHPSHGYANGLSIGISGVEPVGGITPNGTFALSLIDADTYSVTFGSHAGATTLSANPISTTAASATVTVHQPAHGLTDGATVLIAGASAVGGITPNGSFPISVVDTDNYSFTFTAGASSTATGGGSAVTVFASPAGGDTVTVQPQTAFAAGNIDGTGGAGFGTGAYGDGLYGEPSTAIAYPRTWSLAAWGETLMACPRGGTLYQWTNDPATPALAVANAPAEIGTMLVLEQRQVMAFGCNQEADGVFNPMCIRYTDFEDPTDWVSSVVNNAGEIVLDGGGRLVGAVLMGAGFMCWSDSSAYLGTYVGAFGQTWRVDRIASGCGLIGPQAATAIGQTAFWLSPQGQVFSCALGSEPQPLACPLRDDMFDNLATVQFDKIVAAVVGPYDEVWWFYPDGRDGVENSRAIFVNTADAGLPWSKAILARTAFHGGQPADHPVGVDPTGRAYWHERGATADGGAIGWFLESGDQYLDSTQTTFQVQRLIPDFKDQQGPINVEVLLRMEPQAAEASTGAIALAPTDTRADFRMSGRLGRLRLSGQSSPAYWRMGAPIFVAEPARQR